eukprot:7582937-Lingulodinium_polyedra.AAC.1
MFRRVMGWRPDADEMRSHCFTRIAKRARENWPRLVRSSATGKYRRARKQAQHIFAGTTHPMGSTGQMQTYH